MCTTCYATITDFSRTFAVAVRVIAGSDAKTYQQDAFASCWAHFASCWEEGRPEDLPCAEWRPGQRETLAVASSHLVAYMRRAVANARQAEGLAQTGRTKHTQGVRLVYSTDSPAESVEFTDMAALKGAVRLDRRAQLDAGDDLDVLWASIRGLGASRRGYVEDAIASAIDRAEGISIGDILSAEALDQSLLTRWLEIGDPESPRWRRAQGQAILRGIASILRKQSGAWGGRSQAVANANPYIGGLAAAWEAGRDAASAAIASERAFWRADGR